MACITDAIGTAITEKDGITIIETAPPIASPLKKENAIVTKLKHVFNKKSVCEAGIDGGLTFGSIAALTIMGSFFAGPLGAGVGFVFGCLYGAFGAGQDAKNITNRLCK